MSSDKKPAKHLTVFSGKTASDSPGKTLASAEKYQPLFLKGNRPEVVSRFVEMLRQMQEQNTPSKKGRKKSLPLSDIIPQDNLGHFNEGWGLDEADACALADRMQSLLVGKTPKIRGQGKPGQFPAEVGGVFLPVGGMVQEGIADILRQSVLTESISMQNLPWNVSSHINMD